MTASKRVVVWLAISALAALAVPVVAQQHAVAAQAVPGHTALVPTIPRTDTPRISNGEIWDIEVVGSRVFIAGSFTGIANVGGANVPQASLAAYDINTGKIDMTFRPVFGGGGALAVEASPNGTALYVAGTFNTVNGVAKRKIARLNPTTGAPIAGFTATANARATALAATNSTVYVGGQFTTVNNVTRGGLAALNGTTGAVDAGFNLPLSGGLGVGGQLAVQQLKLTHDDTKLLVVHTGRQIAGQDRYGVGLISTATKTLLPWRTRLWEDYLPFVGGIQRVYAGDIAPNDSYFVVTSGSGGDRPPINDTAIAFPMNGADNVQPLWVSRHFDSVYSVAITERAVYVGGHFSWQESPTSPVPWPGLDNVGYGTGQGLSGYGLGDQVVRRDHLGALDPATGTALEWNPISNSYEGVKAIEATPRGLFVGGDGMYQGGYNVGRVGFYDFTRAPAASAVDTTIVTPLEGAVKPAGQSFVIDGRAVAPAGATRVDVEIQNRNGAKQYLQDDLTTWGAFNTISAPVGTLNATNTTWSLSVSLPGGEYQLRARTIGRNGTSDPTKALKKIETFRFDDLTPTTDINSPSSGLLATTNFVATGTARDDKGVNGMSYWFRTTGNRYLQDDGSVASVFNTFRGDPDVIGATNATWQYEVTLPEGEWTMSATAIDTAGQPDLRGDTRDWTISATGQPPTVAISTPVAMTPPGPVTPLTVEPGQQITFSGTATDESALRTVEIFLRNNTTREALAADGTWGSNSIAAFYRISPINISATSFNWTYTSVPLTPGIYDFRVRATDDLGLTTSSANQGRLSITAQVPGDAFPNGLLNFTGVDAEHRHAAPRHRRDRDGRQGRAVGEGRAVRQRLGPLRPAERHAGRRVRHGGRHARLAGRGQHDVHVADRPAVQGRVQRDGVGVRHGRPAGHVHERRDGPVPRVPGRPRPVADARAGRPDQRRGVHGRADRRQRTGGRRRRHGARGRPDRQQHRSDDELQRRLQQRLALDPGVPDQPRYSGVELRVHIAGDPGRHVHGVGPGDRQLRPGATGTADRDGHRQRLDRDRRTPRSPGPGAFVVLRPARHRRRAGGSRAPGRWRRSATGRGR